MPQIQFKTANRKPALEPVSSHRTVGHWFVLTLCCLLNSICIAQDDLPFQDDFKADRGAWEFVDAESWRFEKLESGESVLHQFQKASEYKPPVRSPFHIALLKDIDVDSFQLDVDVKSTHPDYGHRDACLFFGHQAPDRFYYVHLGKSTDDHANQIFIVNRAARKKISTKTTEGTPWDDQWHHVRVKRDAKSGTIEVYFDDMTNPVMTASDTTFGTGRVGLGSFDDTAMWDNFKLKLLTEDN